MVDLLLIWVINFECALVKSTNLEFGMHLGRALFITFDVDEFL